MTVKQSWADGRLELKSVIPERSVARVQEWITARPEFFRQAFPDRIVNNVYLDTPELRSWTDNIAGISERAKVRLRWYGPSLAPAPGTLEVKLKRNKLGLKLSYDARFDAESTRWSVLHRNLRQSLVPDGATWLSYHTEPVLMNRYRRSYMVSGDGRLRITLDFDHEVRDQRHKALVNLKPVPTLTKYVILEVKCAGGDADKVSGLLRSFPGRLSRFSKYSQGLEGLVL